MKLTVACNVTGIGIFNTALGLEPGVHWSMLERLGQPKILGVHVDAGEEQKGCIPIRVRLSNGAIERDGSGFCGAVNYDTLHIEFPVGWLVYAPGRAGTTWLDGEFTMCSLVVPGAHHFPEQRFFTRTFILYRPGHAADAIDLYRLHGLEIAKTISDFGPQRVKLPKVDRRNLARLARLRNSVMEEARAMGASAAHLGFQTDAMGPFFISGDQNDPGAVGGDEIEFCEGFGQNVPAVLGHVQEHDDCMQRMLCMYDKETGSPVGVDAFASAHGFSPDYDASRSDQPNGVLPFFKQPEIGSPNGCPYRTALRAYKPIDLAHYLRAVGDGAAAWEFLRRDSRWAWLASSIAHEICTLAEEARCVWSDRGESPHPSGWVPRNLSNRLEEAGENPGQGGYGGREFGEVAWVGAVALKIMQQTMTGSSALEDWIQWGFAMIDYRDSIAMPSGVLQRGSYPSAFNGVPWQDGSDEDGGGAGVPKHLDVAQRMECSIAHQGCIAIARVLAGDGGIQGSADTFLNACDNLYVNPKLKPLPPPKDWQQPTQRGASKWIAVAPRGGQPFAELDAQYGPGDPAHVLHDLAMAYLLSKDTRYLRAMLRYDHPVKTLHEKRAYLEAHLDPWGVLALSVLQDHLK